MNMRYSRLCMWLGCLAVSAAMQGQPYDLKCEMMTDPMGINTVTPHFSWKNRGILRQTAYQVQVSTDSMELVRNIADRWQSERMMTADQTTVYKGKALQPGELCFWRVLTYDENGAASAWSPISRFGVGLDETTLKGSYLLLPASAGCQEAPLFRKQVQLKKGQRTLIHVNSLGYHEVYVNGQRLGHQVLAPAMTQLDKRSAIVTYDATDAVCNGKNDIVIALGQGWYKPLYFKAEHPGPVVKAEVDVKGKKGWQTAAATDATWLAAPSGYSGFGNWEPWQFGGERLDARQQPKDMTTAELNRLTWTPAEVVSVGVAKATPQMMAGNHIARVIHPKSITRRADGKWLIDMGTCLSGGFAMRFDGLREGQEIKMEYFDHVKDGEPKGQNEHDEYIARGEDGERFSNRFHTHAYQYVMVSGLDKAPRNGDIEGLLLTATDETGSSFRCSDDDLNAIHDLVKYTLRCVTFSGYMVDCPHIERMGYGGDGNSSTQTAQGLFDLAPTYYNWLQAWDDVQGADGSLPYVAPAGIRCGGGPYWSAFIVKAPWRTYWNYGDDRLLREHYGAMKKWLGYVEQYSPEGLLQPWPDTDNRYWYIGDWLAPAGIDVQDKQSVTFVSNAFVSECLGDMAAIARMLGHESDSQRYADWQKRLRARLLKDFWHAADSTFASGSVLDLSLAVMSGVATGETAAAVNRKLVDLSRTRYNSHIATGLMGVPIFTEWATRERQTELMYDILKQPDNPGYLHMIRSGATTTWESWDHERSSIHNCYNGIGTWFYEALGGITPLEPGFRRVAIRPQFAEHLNWVEVTRQTPYGAIEVVWRRDASDRSVVALEVVLPPGVTAEVEGDTVGAGRHTWRVR